VRSHLTAHTPPAAAATQRGLERKEAAHSSTLRANDALSGSEAAARAEATTLGRENSRLDEELRKAQLRERTLAYDLELKERDRAGLDADNEVLQNKVGKLKLEAERLRRALESNMSRPASVTTSARPPSRELPNISGVSGPNNTMSHLSVTCGCTCISCCTVTHLR
jgi:chromosome segregation ATPase